jgi:hypothetical protein
METATAVFSWVGAAANVAMAIAAGAAFFLWRKQVVWASHHQLARDLSGTLRLVSITLDATLCDLRVLALDDEDHVLGKAHAHRALPGNVRTLDDALKRLGALEGELTCCGVTRSLSSLLLSASSVHLSLATLMHIARLTAVTPRARRRKLCMGSRVSRRPSSARRISTPLKSWLRSLKTGCAST